MTVWSGRLPRDLSPTELSSVMAQARAAGAVDLTVSNPTLPEMELPLSEDMTRGLVEAIGASVAEPYLPDAHGGRPIRQAVRDYVSQHTPATDLEDVWVAASTSELYGQLFKLLCDPGDRVAVPAPSYPLFEQLASLEGVEVVSYGLDYVRAEGQWRLDEDSLQDVLSTGVKAVLTVQPNNPTGSVSRAEEAIALCVACREAKVALVVDEVFAPYCEYPRFVTRIPQHVRPLLFVLDGLSKAAALPQVKLAWGVAYGPESARREALLRLGWIADGYLSVSSLAQAAGTFLLPRALGIQEAVKQRVDANLLALRRAVADLEGVEVLGRDGGWYAVLRVPQVCSEDSWVTELAQHDGVILHPGYFYDFSSGCHLVLTLLRPQPQFGTALGRLCKGMPRITAEAL